MTFNFSRIRGMALLGVLAAGLFATQHCAASAFIYKFDDVLGGATPLGTSPWITATFSDVSPGVVQLTIAAGGLVGSEYLSGLYLNLDSGSKPKSLDFSYVSGSGGFALPSISSGNDKFKADGEGKFDVDLAFSTKKANTFTDDEYVIYDISSSAFTLDATDFDALSKAGQNGAFLAAAKIAGIPDNCSTSSAWLAPCAVTLVPIPEPSTVSLMAAGMAGLFFFRWLQVRRARPMAR